MIFYPRRKEVYYLNLFDSEKEIIFKSILLKTTFYFLGRDFKFHFAGFWLLVFLLKY